MTWAGIIAGGSGKVEYRLTIEGLAYSFSTSSAITKAPAYGGTNLPLLLRDGLVIEDKSSLAHAEVEASGMIVSILDRARDDATTAALSYQPSVVTYLNANCAVTDSTLTVTSTTGIVAGDVIHVGTEAMLVSNVDSGTQFAVTRAVRDTIAQAHYVSDGANLTTPAVALARPFTIEGRRVRLHAYGEGDSGSGDGTLIWRGICATDARLESDGCTWTIELDPITSLFDQDLGTDLEQPLYPRGIYYSSETPLIIRITERSGAGTLSAATGQVMPEIVIPTDSANGFFESNADLCVAINALIDLTGFNADRIMAVADGDDDWHFEFDTDAATARALEILVVSELDTGDGDFLRARTYDETGAELFGDPVSTSATYLLRWGSGSERSVPRGSVGWSARTGIRRLDDDTSTYPANRIYLGGAAGVASYSGCEVRWPDGSTVRYAISGRDTTERYITLGDESMAFHRWDAADLPEIRLGRRYAIGTLADFRDALVSTTAGAPVMANFGAMPFVTSDDLASWTTPVSDAARGRQWASRRSYYSTQAVKLGEMISHECRLLGVYPYVDSNCKIGLRPLRLAAGTEVTSATVSHAQTLIDAGFPQWERGAFGTINTVVIKTGWDALQNQHVGDTYVVRDVQSISTRHAARQLDVAPMSGYVLRQADPRAEIDIAGATALAQTVLGVFGGAYSVLTVEVPFSLFAQTVGTAVSITIPTVPDPLTGARGLEAGAGIITARRWDLDQCRGVFTILASLERISGYTPSVVVTNTSGAGTTWTLTVSSTAPSSGPDMFATGDTFANRFATGDQVLVWKWNNATPAAAAGSVTTTTATTIKVEFDGAWDPGADTWIVSYDVAAQADASQDDYVYLAPSSLRIGFGTAKPAYVFGP